MTILELREKRNKAWEAAKAFVETKRDKDGLLSDEDAKTYAEMEQKVQNYTSEIERMQAMEAMEAELSKPVNTPITHKPMNGGKDTGDGKAKTGRASDAYKAGMAQKSGTPTANTAKPSGSAITNSMVTSAATLRTFAMRTSSACSYRRQTSCWWTKTQSSPTAVR